MTLTALVERLARLELTLREEGGRLRVRGAAGAVSAELRCEIAAHKEGLLSLLRQRSEDVEPPSPSMPACLSPLQQRIWFADRLAPASGLYNVCVGIRMRGALSIRALERSLGEIVRRHDALRTTFVDDHGQPRPIVAAAVTVPLPVRDLRGAPDREVALAQLAGEAADPFDLAIGPLLRASVVTLGDDDHVLHLCLHHLVTDGWSLGLLARELAALYPAYCRGLTPPLPEPATTYAEYARRAQARLGHPELAEQRRYWQERLAGVPALQLPCDHPRPRTPSHRGCAVRFRVPPALSAGIKALGQAQGSTLYVTLLAAFAALLQRHGRQTDFAIGTMVAARGDRRTRDLLGFFVNTLALRCDLSGDPSFPALLGRLHECAREAFAHAEIPFDHVVQSVARGGDSLFQAALVFESAPMPALTVDQMTWEPLLESPDGAVPGTAKFDLCLAIAETPDGLFAALEASTDLFDLITVQRLAQRFEGLLAAIVQSPQLRLSELPVSTAEERALVGSWNAATTRRFEGGRVHGLFEAQAERTPDAPAVVFEGQALSYRELEARANQVAGQLVAMGVMRGSLVGIHVERSLEMVVGVLGVLKAGAAYVPLDPGFPADRLAYMVADAGAAVVLTQAQLPQVGHAPRLCFDRDAAAIAARPTARVDGGATGGDLAYVIYTSGSTGRPKGVEVQHASVVNLLRSIAEEPGLGASDTVVAVTSLSFDTAVADLYWPLSVGARIVIASRSVACDGFALAQLLSDSGATLMQATPATWRILLGASWTNPGKIRVLSTGEALPPSLAAELLARTDQLWNLYGPTETTVWSTLCRIESATAPIGVGHPVANTRTYVVDAQGQPVPVGVPGELCLGGAGLARGYLGRPELTASQFVVDPFSPEPGARMYRTGDLVRQRQDGSLECLGRLDHQVKIRGFRIELGEIEAALCGHASVTQAVVVARETAGAARLVGYVVGEPGLCTSALRAHLEQELPGYMVPAQLVVLAAMPLGPTGKIDRKALPDVEADPALDHVAPRDATEELLAGIWSEVLGVERVGVHDDFFALGGHSLLATQLVSRVRHAFGVEVPVRALFEAPTLAAFRGCLAGAAASTALPLERAPRDSKLPLSFSQQRLWFLDQLEPGSPAYNMPAALRLRGTLEVATLRRVFAEVVRRHEVLRTRLVADAGQPHQVVDAPSDWPLPVVELAHLGAAQAEAETLRLAAEEARRPFDLAAGPLLRTTLLRLAPAHHVLLVTLHHVVADAWSIEVLVREIAALFAAFSRDQPSPLPELAIQYADFASWQRHALSADALGTSLAYWKAQLAGVPVLELPTDRPRPPVQSYAGARVPLVLPSELTRALLRLSREENATLFMTLLAAFDVLVCRYSGQTDLCVGTAVACRTRPEIEPLIGMFVNSLALRSDLSQDPPFTEVLRRVRHTSLEAYAHQDLPLDRLVEQLGIARDSSRSPLFQVMFSLHDEVLGDVVLDGVTLRPIELEACTSKLDLTLAMTRDGAELRGAFEYSSDLFDRSTIERMSGHFLHLLASAVKTREARISELALAPDAGRRIDPAPRARCADFEEGEL